MNLLLVSDAFSYVTTLLPSGSKIGFIATANELYEDRTWVFEERNQLSSYGYTLFDLDISHDSISSLKDILKQVDALFVSGGNTFYLMQQLKKIGFDQEIISFIHSDRLYIGASAGCAILSPTLEPYLDFDPIEEAPELLDLIGLCVLPVIVLPHAGNEEYGDVHAKALEKYQTQYIVVSFHDNEVVPVTDPVQYKIIHCN